MEPPSYMRSVVDRNAGMQRMTVLCLWQLFKSVSYYHFHLILSSHNEWPQSRNTDKCTYQYIYHLTWYLLIYCYELYAFWLWAAWEWRPAETRSGRCYFKFLNFFIITNKCTINIIKIYITKISLCNPHSYMFPHFHVTISQFTANALLSYTRSSNCSC